MENNSITKTLLVVILLCGVCSLIVSAVAVQLRPLQEANEELELRKTILQVTDMYRPGQDVLRKSSAVESRIVNLASGQFANEIDVDQFDMQSAISDPALSSALPPEQDIASIGRLPKYAKVHLIKKDEKLKYIVLPIQGYGLWSTLYGFIALYPDGNTVYGLKFYQHKETPGLGGRVDDFAWRKQWRGKKIYDTTDNPALTIGKCASAKNTSTEYRLDGLSGATITSCGVNNMISFWFSEKGYNRFLTVKPFNKGVG